MKHSEFYVGNDHAVVLEGLALDDGTVVTDAVVTVEEIVDSAGNAVSGETLPITLAHESSGTYKGSIAAALEIVAGEAYEATIKAVSNGITGTWQETLLGKIRRA